LNINYAELPPSNILSTLAASQAERTNLHATGSS